MLDVPESVPTVPRCLPVLPAGNFNGGQTEFLRFVTLALQGLLETHREQQQDQLHQLQLQLHIEFQVDRERQQQHHQELLQQLKREFQAERERLVLPITSQLNEQTSRVIIKERPSLQRPEIKEEEEEIPSKCNAELDEGMFTWTTTRVRSPKRRVTEVGLPTSGAHIRDWFDSVLMVPPSFARKSYAETILGSLVHSRIFLLLSGWLMVSNSVYVGWYANFSVKNEWKWYEERSRDERPWIGNITFNVLFALEVSIRFFGLGWKQYFSRTRFWNVLDVILVILPVFFVHEGKDAVPRYAFWRILRIFRLIHTFPMFRLPLFAHLRMITNALLRSLPAFLWAVTFGCLFLYMASVGFCLGLARKLQTEAPLSDVSQARNYFADLAQSMKHLYMALTNGIDWIEIHRAVTTCDQQMSIGFMIFSVFMVFAVVNIISAMFIERAFNVIRNDREFWVVEEAHRRSEHRQRIFGLFDEMDKDGSEDISWDEFESAFENPHVEAYLAFVDLNPGNLHDMFQLIDKDKNGRIDINELLDGLELLKGPAKRVEVLRLYQLLRDLLLNEREFLQSIKSALGASGVQQRS